MLGKTGSHYAADRPALFQALQRPWYVIKPDGAGRNFQFAAFHVPKNGGDVARAPSA